MGEWSPVLAAELMARCFPDLADGPARGGLLELVRAAWSEPDLVVEPRSPYEPVPVPVVRAWCEPFTASWWVLGDGWCSLGMVEAEPLVVALVEAPTGCWGRALWHGS